EWYLIKNMVSRDLKGRYSRASIGFGWIFLEPLLLSAVYYFLFTIIANRPEPNYALHVIIGVIVWGHFGKSLQATISCLSNGGNLIKQVYFPREILAISPVLSQLWISVISLTAVIPVMLYLGVMPSTTIWMLPVALILTSMLALGFGLIFAPLNAFSQDVSHLFRFIIRAGFFLSPVMWTYEMMITRAPDNWVNIIMLNPMVIPLTYARHGLDGTTIEFEVTHLLYCVGVAVLSLLIGMAIFKRLESKAVKHL
ncbi:MAG TPA: ABC transporter permease, partial [Candidatus Poseidoniales archaeon]|nr:ABC transporter permease [Candidatus Poseidoniales archaeon]